MTRHAAPVGRWPVLEVLSPARCDPLLTSRKRGDDLPHPRVLGKHSLCFPIYGDTQPLALRATFGEGPRLAGGGRRAQSGKSPATAVAKAWAIGGGNDRQLAAERAMNRAAKAPGIVRQLRRETGGNGRGNGGAGQLKRQPSLKRPSVR